MSAALPPRASVRTAAIWAMASQYLAFAIQFATSVLISRLFLSPAEVGLFSTALAAAMLLATLQDFGITRFVAGEATLDADKLRRCFSVSLAFALAVGVAILLVAGPAARFYGDARLVPILLVIAASYLLVPFAIVPVALLQRRLDFASVAGVNVGGAAAMAAVALGLAAAGYSSLALAWGTVAQAGARAAIATWRSGARPHLPLTFRGAAPILRFGGGASVLYVSGALGTRTPELVVGKLLGFVAVGLYGRAVGLSGTLRQLVGGAIGQVFFPAFARLRDEGADFAEPFGRVVAAYTVTTWPAMLFLAAAAEPVVSLLFGPRWLGVAPLLRWIALGEIVFAALPLHMDIPIVLGRMRRLLALNLLDTAASVALIAAGAWIGVEAAAASRLAYGLVWFALYAAFMQRLVGFRWRALAALYAQGLACAAATVLPLALLGGRLLAPVGLGFGALAAAAAAGVLCWAATLVLVRHPVRAELMGTLRDGWTRLRPATR